MAIAPFRSVRSLQFWGNIGPLGSVIHSVGLRVTKLPLVTVGVSQSKVVDHSDPFMWTQITHWSLLAFVYGHYMITSTPKPPVLQGSFCVTVADFNSSQDFELWWSSQRNDHGPSERLDQIKCVIRTTPDQSKTPNHTGIRNHAYSPFQSFCRMSTNPFFRKPHAFRCTNPWYISWPETWEIPASNGE